MSIDPTDGAPPRTDDLPRSMSGGLLLPPRQLPYDPIPTAAPAATTPRGIQIVADIVGAAGGAAGAAAGAFGAIRRAVATRGIS